MPEAKAIDGFPKRIRGGFYQLPTRKPGEATRECKTCASLLHAGKSGGPSAGWCTAGQTAHEQVMQLISRFHVGTGYRLPGFCQLKKPVIFLKGTSPKRKPLPGNRQRRRDFLPRSCNSHLSRKRRMTILTSRSAQADNNREVASQSFFALYVSGLPPRGRISSLPNASPGTRQMRAQKNLRLCR